MTDKERRIREVAHRIWEDEGPPADQAERHWEMAQRVVEADPKGSEPTLVPERIPKGSRLPAGRTGLFRLVPNPLSPGARSESRESKPAYA